MPARERPGRKRGVRLGPTGWAGVALSVFVFALGWYVCAQRFGWIGGLLGWWPSAIVAAAVGLGPISLVRRIRGARRSSKALEPPAVEPEKRTKTRQPERIRSDLPAD